MKKIITILILFLTLIVKSQIIHDDRLLPNPEQAKALMEVQSDLNSRKFEPYVKAKYGAGFDFNTYKLEQRLKYLSELWYYYKSFYVKRNYTTGETLDETIIDISRFDFARKSDEEVIITIEGFKDAIVLIPTKKLLFTND